MIRYNNNINFAGLTEYLEKATDDGLLIILGDMGLEFRDTEENKKFTEQFLAIKKNIAIVDGNHENFEDHPDYFPGRGLNRYNVTGVWKGREDINELMLMGHIDTVEIGDVKNWGFDPLLGEAETGKFSAEVLVTINILLQQLCFL